MPVSSTMVASTTTRILEEALNLSEQDRAKLAEALFESLGRAPESEEQFFSELDRRREQVTSGEVDPIPWSEVRRRWEEQVARKSSTSSLHESLKRAGQQIEVGETIIETDALDNVFS